MIMGFLRKTVPDIVAMNPEMHQIIRADPTEPDIPMIPFGEIKIPGGGFCFIFKKISCLFLL